MEVEQKPKIEALYPLTLHQQGLLFHHLSDDEDVGALLVQCKLNGRLDFEFFKSAWQQTANRHEVLRSSVHWKKIETPVILVRPEATMHCERIDWSSFTLKEQEEKLNKIQRDLKNEKITLEKNPLTNIFLIKLGANSYSLLWYCHHLLLDGWSSNIILNDFMQYYEMLSNGQEARLETVPSYNSYLNWIKNNSDNEAKIFWNKTLDGLNEPKLFQQAGQYEKGKLGFLSKLFSEEESIALIAMARENQITINTLFQGIWSVVLSQYFNSEEVVFGTTVSGRSSGFPKIELMTGMFTNVIPVRANLSQELEVFECFKNIQTQQQIARNYEQFSVEELLETNKNIKGSALFDSLFVFENFPGNDIIGSDLKLSDFSSGVSSSYPLTLIISTKKNIKVELIFDENVLTNNISNWLIEQFGIIAKKLLTSKNLKNGELISILNTATKFEKASVAQKKRASVQANYVAASTEIEGVLIAIWQDVFKISTIGVHDNFFSLGGKSLMAVKIFAKLSEKHSIKLPPTTLLDCPTVAEIAHLIDSGGLTSSAMEFIVPLRTKGTKPPLFCIHAGGGHVFFYHNLPNYLNDDRPVYAVQPATNIGKEKRHNSIAQMTTDYLNEIKQVQEKGPYHILVYCFSAVVGFEMIRQLKELNEEAHIMVIDTPPVQHKVYLDSFAMRAKKFVKNFIKQPSKAIEVTVINRVKRHLKPLRIRLFGSSHDKNLEILRQNLVVNYTKYNWQKIDCEIDLIITEKVNKNLNAKMLKSWQNLVSKVSIENIQGEHGTLFEEPDVRFVGEKLEELMVSYKSK